MCASINLYGKCIQIVWYAQNYFFVCTRKVVISLYVNKDNVIPQENNEQFKFVMKYHILFQMRILMCLIFFFKECLIIYVWVFYFCKY